MSLYDRLTGFFSIVLLLLSLGCVPEPGDLSVDTAKPVTGSEGGACDQNGQCFSGLVCLSNLCVKQTADATDAADSVSEELPIVDLALDLIPKPDLTGDKSTEELPRDVKDIAIVDLFKPKDLISDQPVDTIRDTTLPDIFVKDSADLMADTQPDLVPDVIQQCNDDNFGVSTWNHPNLAVYNGGQSQSGLAICNEKFGSNNDWFALKISQSGQYRVMVTYKVTGGDFLHLALYTPGNGGVIDPGLPTIEKLDFGLGKNILFAELAEGTYYVRVEFKQNGVSTTVEKKYDINFLYPCFIDDDCMVNYDEKFCDVGRCIQCKQDAHCIALNPKTPACDAGICKECTGDKHCVDQKNIYGGVCVDKVKGKCGCSTNKDCNSFGSRPICRDVLGVKRCDPCAQNVECRSTNTPAQWVCNKGRCLECFTNDDCGWDPSTNPNGNPNSLGRTCNTTNNTCGCSDDFDCWNVIDGQDHGHPHGSKCDPIINICVCKSNADCGHLNARGNQCIEQPIGIGGFTDIPLCSQ